MIYSLAEVPDFRCGSIMPDFRNYFIENKQKSCGSSDSKKSYTPYGGGSLRSQRLEGALARSRFATPLDGGADLGLASMANCY